MWIGWIEIAEYTYTKSTYGANNYPAQMNVNDKHANIQTALITEQFTSDDFKMISQLFQCTCWVPTRQVTVS